MPETTLLIKAALNLRVGAVFDVYNDTIIKKEKELLRALLIQFCKLEVVSLVIQPILLRQYQSNHPYYC